MSEDICDRLVCFNQHKQCLSSDLEVEAAAEITRLREDLSGTIKRMSKLDFERTAAEFERDALREENARLRKLLFDFEKFQEIYEKAMEKTTGTYGESAAASILTYGHLRAARAAILRKVKDEAACPAPDEAP